MKRVSTAQERMELYRKLADIPEPNRPTNYPLLGQGDMGEWDRYNQTLDAGLNPMQSPDEQQGSEAIKARIAELEAELEELQEQLREAEYMETPIEDAPYADTPDTQRIRDHIGPSLRGQGLNNPGA